MQPNTPDEKQLPGLEAFIRRLMEVHKARGLALAVIGREGSTLHQSFSGFRDAARRLPVDENTIFGLASVTKSFTALALMQLAEKGLLSLSDPASRHCPVFKNRGSAPVTLAHFLSHSGGYFPLRRSTLRPAMEKLGLKEDGPEDLAENELLAEEGIETVARGLDAQTPRLGEPGEFMSYCNDGYGVLADVIRRVGGEGSYASFVRRHILEPLGMDRSGCGFLAPARDPNVSLLYSEACPGGDLDFCREAFVLMGGGAMKSTLADMKKYLLLFLNEGKGPASRLLSPSGIRAMVRPRIPTRTRQFYGYGLTVSFLNDLTVLRHGGSLPGVSSHIAWLPELGLGVLVLCNTENVPVSLAADVALRWAAGLSPEVPDPWTDRPWSSETIRAACGDYASEEGAKISIRHGTKGLSVQNAGRETAVRTVQPRLALLRSGLSDTELRLLTADDNSVWGVRLGDRILPRVPGSEDSPQAKEL